MSHIKAVPAAMEKLLTGATSLLFMNSFDDASMWVKEPPPPGRQSPAAASQRSRLFYAGRIFADSHPSVASSPAARAEVLASLDQTHLADFPQPPPIYPAATAVATAVRPHCPTKPSHRLTKPPHRSKNEN